MTTNKDYDLDKMLPGVLACWRDGVGCHWCRRPTKNPVEGHDGYCPVPALFKRDAEVERLQGRIEVLEQERNAAYVHAGAVGAAMSECRTEVLKFARAMEERLRANDHKGGWKSEDPTWLLGRMLEEAHELAQAVPDGAVLHEAADVANFCLMVADVCWDWQAGEAK